MSAASLLKDSKKRTLFFFILIFILVIGTLLSLFTKMTFIEDDEATRPRIVVISPFSKDGESLRQGVELYIDDINRSGGINGQTLEMVEQPSSAVDVGEIARDERVIGVVGYLDKFLLKKDAAKFQSAGIPLVTPLYLDEPITGVISMGSSPRAEASFTANYARNIDQQRIMYVIRESGSEFDDLVVPFVDVYERFESPVQNIWTLDTNPDYEELDALINAVSQIDIGSIYIATSPVLAAKLVKAIRSTGNVLQLFGPSTLASNIFIESLEEQSGERAVDQLNGIIAATPVLLDTSNDKAQRFQNRFETKNSFRPDWLAAISYDAAQLAIQGPTAKDLDGVTGEKKITAQKVDHAIQVGVYRGDRLISAPVQMLPIAKGTNFNYIDALKDGRVLYVNDRFMFKTNVVYVGFATNSISNVDTQAETADVDMSIWFRYQGDFKPNDIEVFNAQGVVNLGDPEEVSHYDDIQYRRYRVKQNLKLNFTQGKRSYGHHIAGLSFRHRLLNRNNLMYVVDVLGMPTGNDLIKDLQKKKVTEAGGGWVVKEAWVSQDIIRERGKGVPQYVGMTGELPLFSTITLGIEIKPEAIAARDIVKKSEYFIYIAIFGFLGFFVARFLDWRKRRFWSVQSWLLRVIFLPMALLSIGNLVIDWSFANNLQSTTNLIFHIYRSLWWILCAHLINMAVGRFVWVPIEQKAGRPIPNIMKHLLTAIIYLLAFAGVVAIVFEQPLTSLLATSGMLAMIIGLAIQANIANIFSGIILNIERPFKVGDFIKINDDVGQVRDITWRTVRIESIKGPIISLANSQVSEAYTSNFSQLPYGLESDTEIFTPPDVDAEKVLQIVNEAIASNDGVMYKDDENVGMLYRPRAHFMGVVNYNGHWVAKFSAVYRVQSRLKGYSAKQEFWLYVKKRFLEEGIPLVNFENTNIRVLSEATAAAEVV